MEKPPEVSINNIAPTAWMIAYIRTFTNIPYSKEVFEACESLRESDVPEIFKSPEIAPQIEARHKLINKLLNESGINQVIELAAGLSPRGLEMTDNPNFNYIEIDLPDVYMQKKRIIEMIGKRDNLHVRAGNAMDINTLEDGLSLLDSRENVVIINEGLLRYLNFKEKERVAKTVHEILERFGGLWITPDISLVKALETENSKTKSKIDQISKRIGINVKSNSFRDIGEALSFFEELGFSVEEHGFLEVVDELVSPERLHQTKKQAEDLIRENCVFVMKAI